MALKPPHNSIRATGDPVSGGRATRNIPAESAPSRPIRAPRRNPGKVDGDQYVGDGEEATIPILSKRVPQTGRTPTAELDHQVDQDLWAPILIQESAHNLSSAGPLSGLDPRDLHTVTSPLRGGSVPLILLCLLVMGTFAGDAIVGGPVLVPVEATQSGTLPVRDTGIKLIASSTSVLRTVEVADPDSTRPPGDLVEPRELSDSDTVVVSSLQETENELLPPAVDLEQARLLESQLREAERLLNAGVIIALNEPNAVKVLERVLRADPTNNTALDLIHQCANLLLVRAEAAYASGDDFEARNLVEEVLAFHPDHKQARDQWSGFVTGATTPPR